MPKVFILCSAILLTACAEEDPQQFIAEGKALFEKGELKSARVQFKNAIQINPGLAEAYYGLALLDEKKKDWSAMKQNMLESVRLDPNHLDAQVKLGFMLTGQLDKVKEKLAVVQKLAPNDLGVILLDGAVKYKEGNKFEAKKLVEKVLAKDEANVDAIRLLVSMLTNEKGYDEALLIIDRGIQKRPNNLDLLLLKISKLTDLKKYDEVIPAYDDLVAKFPKDKTLRQSQVDALVRIGKPELIEKVLREAVSSHPAEISFKLALVGYMRNMGGDQAEELLKGYIKESPEEARFKFRLAGYYLKNKKNAEAQALLNEIMLADPRGKDGLMAKARLAKLAWERADKVLAEKLAGETLNIDRENSDALLLRAEILLDKRKVDEAIADLRIVLRDRPDLGMAMVLMARASFMKGEPEVAESYWKKAVQANPNNLKAIVPLVAILIRRGDASRAEELLDKSIKVNPGNSALVEVLVKLRAEKKDWAGAEAAVNELKKFPRSVLASEMLTGMLAEIKGQYLDAIQIYKDILSRHPNAEGALNALPKLYVMLDRREDFVAFLQGFIKENKENILAHKMLGQVYMFEKNWIRAYKVLQKALNLDPTSISTYGLLASVLMQQGKEDEIVELYGKGLKVLPGSIDLMMSLARHHERAKAYDKAVIAYGDVVNISPDNKQAANNLAFLLTYSIDDPSALERAIILVERFKDSPNPFFQDTYGWVLLKSGEAEKAVAVLKKTVLAVPDNAEFRYHLGESYFAIGDMKAGKAELEKYVALTGQKGVQEVDGRVKELLGQISASVAEGV